MTAPRPGGIGRYHTLLDARTFVRRVGETAMDLRGVGYLGFAVPDPAEWAAFATSVIGLMPAPAPPPSDEAIFFKGDERQWRIALHRSEKAGLAYVGLELGSQMAFDAARARLEQLGISSTGGSA